MVAALAEVGNKSEFTAFQVFDTTPGKIRRLRAGSAPEIALVDQCDSDTARGKRSGRNSTVNSGTQNEYIEMAFGKLIDVVLTKF